MLERVLTRGETIGKMFLRIGEIGLKTPSQVLSIPDYPYPGTPQNKFS